MQRSRHAAAPHPSPCMSDTALVVVASARSAQELREQARGRARSGAAVVWSSLSKPERLAGSESRIERKEGSNNMEGLFVGVDVSKAWLDCAAEPPAGAFRFANDAGGIAALVTWLRERSPTLVVLEASGGWETEAASALVAAGMATVVVNPKQVRAFAKGMGLLAKTDRLDARVLALFGQRIRPEVRPLPSAEQRDLAELLDRRAQLVTIRAQERARLVTALAIAKPSLQEHIRWLDGRIRQLEVDLTAQLRTSTAWQVKANLLQGVPGIGKITIFTLLARLPELGHLNRARIAALAGLAPFAHDSGNRHGARFIQGGRAEVRSVVYMSTLTATKHNPVIKAYFERLIAAGKPFKVAMTACMRKLLTILNAMLKTNQPWRAPTPT